MTDPVAEGNAMVNWAVRQLLLWCGVALVLYLAAAHRWTGQPGAPAGSVSAPVPQQQQGAVPNALVFHANEQGHVLLDANVNGWPVRFLVDTGATYVSLSARDAEAAGLSANNLVYRGMASTANGAARVAPVTLRELRVGQFAAENVPAVVMDNLPISLLGQSFLKRLDSYEMRDGVLTLFWN